MGILRLILALSVVAVHAGPVFGLRYFGNGVMSVETFFMLSGFYMALVLATRYREHTRDFYFNRFLRLFPVYWIIAGAMLLYALAYEAAMGRGHALGALVLWGTPFSAGDRLWAGLANVAIIGSDWAELYSDSTGSHLNKLILIQPI